jgi:hypothetical protein
MKLSIVGTLITAILTLGFPALGQDRDRVVHVLSGHCPATILNLKVASMNIEAQRPFVAPESWLEDLSWEVENTSENQLISYIEFALHFHELGAAGEASVFKLGYGQQPGQASQQGKLNLLLPGQTIKVTFSEEDYKRLKIFVEKKRPVGELQIVEVKVSGIAFDDHSLCPAKGKP